MLRSRINVKVYVKVHLDLFYPSSSLINVSLAKRETSDVPVKDISSTNENGSGTYAP